MVNVKMSSASLQHLEVRVSHLVNKLVPAHDKCTILVAIKVAAKMEGDRFSALKLELVVILQVSRNLQWILGNNAKVVYIGSDVLVVIVDLPHLDVWFCLAWRESHLT